MNTVRKNIGPLSIFILFFTIGLFIVIVYPKLEIQRHINSFYHPKANIIFKFLTHLAEGWFTVPLLVFLFIYNWKKAVYISSIYGISSLFVAVLKHLVFSTFKRPHWFNELLNDKNYRWLPDLNMHDEFSFPSGHTTTAFCIFFGLALLIPNKKIGTTLIILASLIGFSRTYLSYHFLMDLVAGSLLGVTIALGMYLLLKKKLKL